MNISNNYTFEKLIYIQNKINVLINNYSNIYSININNQINTINLLFTNLISNYYLMNLLEFNDQIYLITEKLQSIKYQLNNFIELIDYQNNMIKNLNISKLKHVAIEISSCLINIKYIKYPNYLNISNNKIIHINHKLNTFDLNKDEVEDEDKDEVEDKDEEDEDEYNINQRNLIKNKVIFNINNMSINNFKNASSIKFPYNSNYKISNNNLNKIPNSKNIVQSKKDNNIIMAEKFAGSINIIPNSKPCIYCDKYVDKEYFLSKSDKKSTDILDYCLHCWAWLNFNDVNLEYGVYFGNLNQKMVIEEINKNQNIHKLINCTNPNCLFNEIEKKSKEKKLDVIFCKVIEKKPNKSTKKIKDRMYNITSKNLKINYSKSFIII